MADLGWRRRWGSSPAARRGARQRAGLTPACASNTLPCQCETLRSKLLWSIKNPIDSDHGIYRLRAEQVRAAIPPERLLVFDVADGWEPLCRFLGHKIPNTPFPNTNSNDDFWKL